MALIDHFVEGVSHTIIKLAEKIGMFDHLHQMLKQEKLLPEDLKVRVARFMDKSVSILSTKSIESLGILMAPIYKANIQSTFNFMMNLANAPLFNLNQTSYTRLVINCFI